MRSICRGRATWRAPNSTPSAACSGRSFIVIIRRRRLEVVFPPLRGFRAGEVPAQRAEGSWAAESLLPLTPPSPYDGDTSPSRDPRGGGDERGNGEQSLQGCQVGARGRTARRHDGDVRRLWAGRHSRQG